jgi:hypothetical protein
MMERRRLHPSDARDGDEAPRRDHGPGRAVVARMWPGPGVAFDAMAMMPD